MAKRLVLKHDGSPVIISSDVQPGDLISTTFGGVRVEVEVRTVSQNYVFAGVFRNGEQQPGNTVCALDETILVTAIVKGKDGKPDTHIERRVSEVEVVKRADAPMPEDAPELCCLGILIDGVPYKDYPVPCDIINLANRRWELRTVCAESHSDDPKGPLMALLIGHPEYVPKVLGHIWEIQNFDGKVLAVHSYRRQCIFDLLNMSVKVLKRWIKNSKDEAFSTTGMVQSYVPMLNVVLDELPIIAKMRCYQNTRNDTGDKDYKLSDDDLMDGAEKALTKMSVLKQKISNKTCQLYYWDDTPRLKKKQRKN